MNFPKIDLRVRLALVALFALMGGFALVHHARRARSSTSSALMLGTARKPLVMVAGQAEQIADADPVNVPAGVATSGPIVNTLPFSVTSHAEEILQLNTSVDSYPPYQLTSYEGLWTNEPGGAPYFIHDLILGQNYNGSQLDVTKMSNWLQFEGPWWETNWAPATWGTEFHLASAVPGGASSSTRWITRTSLDDGRGYTSYSATEHTFENNDDTALLLDMTSTGAQFGEKVQISSNDASNVLAVHSASNAQLARFGNADAEIDVPLGVASSSLPQLLVQNPLNTGAGAVQVALYARAGAKTSFIQEDQDGSFILRNNATGSATYFDNASGGYNMRNSTFDNVLTVSNAGDVAVPLGSTTVGRVINTRDTPVIACDGGGPGAINGGEHMGHAALAIDSTNCTVTFGHTIDSCTISYHQHHTQIATGLGESYGYVGNVLTVTAAPSWALGDFDYTCGMAN